MGHLQPAPVSRRLQLLGKSATSLVLVALLVTALWFLFATNTGAHLRENPRVLGTNVRGFIRRYPLSAPAGYLVVYVMFAIAALLPIWPMQLLAGIGFGLYEGTFISLMG